MPLALLSMVTRILAYIGTSSVVVLRRGYADRFTALRLSGGPIISLAALMLTAGLLYSASLENLLTALAVFLWGAVVDWANRYCHGP